jgi:hypothetical protein
MEHSPALASLGHNHPMRRSERLHLEIPILVTSLNPKVSYCEEGKTFAVNAHGCGVILNEPLEKGTRVLLDRISDSGSQSAQVVDAVFLEAGSGWLVGFQFDKPANFWRIDPPPSGWPPV